MGSVAVQLTSGSADPATVNRMLEAAPHRGVPGRTVARGGCVVGVSDGTGSADAGLAVADDLVAGFVGDLSNAAELAPQFGLDANAAERPAEIVLAAFRAADSRAPAMLRGHFAAVVTDGRRLWCFRDHFGFGQLFYRWAGGTCHVATEVKQVVCGAQLSHEPDVETVERIFYADIDEDLPCAVRGVNRVPKRDVLELTPTGIARRRYWTPETVLETGPRAAPDVRDGFEHLMRQAVTRTLTGNDAVSLSGGIDSPAVAAFAAPVHRERWGRPLSAVTMVFPEHPGVDERRYVEAVCASLELPLNTYTPSARPLDDIERWTRLCDGPIPVLPPAQVVEQYRRARDLGFTTLLGGDQAEFVFDQRDHFAAHLFRSGRWHALRRHLVREHERGVGWRPLARRLLADLAPRPLLVHRVRHDRRRDQLPAWIDLARVADVEARHILPARRRWAEGQLAAAGGSGIGMEADDILQAVSGVRVRRPWLDVDLYEFFLSLPAEVKFPELRMKSLVRSLLRGRVPDVVLDRTDKTFFNDFFMSRIDYETFKRLFRAPPHRIAGIDYRLLNERLDRGDLSLGEYKWALDLAKAHAFLNQW